MNSGDFLFCHRDLQKSGINQFTDKVYFCEFEIGKQYQIEYIQEGNIGVKPKENLSQSFVFSLNKDSIYFYKKWFISKAEWREQQINSILDD